MHKYEDSNLNYNYSGNFNYPIILIKFYKVKDKIKTITKSNLIDLLLKEPIYPDANSILLKFFQSTRNFNAYINDYLNKLFFKLNNYDSYDIDKIYNIYILPIVQNCDIYALSLCIYQIFFGGPFFNNILAYEFVDNKTRILVNNLFYNALYNRINGPNELSIKLEEIIKSIDNSDSYYYF
jgi:hypothetical protein